MEIKIDKKFFIKLSCVALFGAACFCTGRLIRFSRIAGAHEELKQRIILTGDTADTILDQLGVARPAGQSSTDTGHAILRGIQELSRANDAARLCIDEIEREVSIAEQNTEAIKQSFDGVSGAIERSWEIVEKQAASYERIVETLQRFDSNSSEDVKEPASRLGNSK